MKDTPPPSQIKEHSPGVQIKEIEKTKYSATTLQIKETIQNEDITVLRKEVSEYKSVCIRDIIDKEKKTNKLKEKKDYSKGFKCDRHDNKYTWYSGLANHRRLVRNHNKEK